VLLLKLVSEEGMEQEVLDVLLGEGIPVECMCDESNGHLQIISFTMCMEIYQYLTRPNYNSFMFKYYGIPTSYLLVVLANSRSLVINEEQRECNGESTSLSSRP